MTRVKICGLTRREDVELALDAGADLLGFVLEAGSVRYVSRARLADLTLGVPEPVGVFGLRAHLVARYDGWTSELDGFKYVQFVYEVKGGVALGIIRAIHGSAEGLPREMRLVDSAIGGRVGGTGRSADWGLAAQLVEAGEVVMLAGGLTPETVGEAVRKVRPFGVDVSSGVEAAPGIKDPGKVRAFVQAVREADGR